MDSVHRAGSGSGCRQRLVRQIPDDASPSHAGAVVVQCLSGVHHVPHYPAPVVSAAKDKYPFPLEVDHCFYIPVSVCGRFCLFLRPQLRRLHDFHRFDGAPRQCGGILLLRGAVLPREESEEQGNRPHSGAHRYVLPLFGQPVGGKVNAFLSVWSAEIFLQMFGRTK